MEINKELRSRLPSRKEIHVGWKPPIQPIIKVTVDGVAWETMEMWGSAAF